jgi:hypothetical protein
MANRYQKAPEERKLRDGRTVYGTVRPTAIRRKSRDIVVDANEQDRSDVIANNIYGSANDWWRIASVNGRVDGSLYFKLGQRLIIPT